MWAVIPRHPEGIADHATAIARDATALDLLASPEALKEANEEFVRRGAGSHPAQPPHLNPLPQRGRGEGEGRWIEVRGLL